MRIRSSTTAYCIVNSLSLVVSLYALNKIPNMMRDMSQCGAIPHLWAYIVALIALPTGAFAMSIWAYRMQERTIARQIRDRQLRLIINLVLAPLSTLNLRNNIPEQVSNRIGYNVETCERYSFAFRTTIIGTTVLAVAYLISMILLDPSLPPCEWLRHFARELSANPHLRGLVPFAKAVLPGPSNVWFALATICSSVIFYLLFCVVKCFRRRKKEIVNMRQFENRATIDTLRGAYDLRASNAVDFARAKLKSALNRTMKVRMELGEAYSFSARADKFVQGIAQFLIVIVIYIGKGSFVDMFTYAGTCWLFIEQASRLFDLRILQRRQNFAARELAKLENLPQTDLTHNEPADPGKPVLEIFQKHTTAGNTPVMSILPRQRIGLVGLTGSGKSTLLRMIANELEPSGNTEMTFVRRGRIRHVRQAPYLFDYRLFENILFRDYDAADARTPEQISHVVSLIKKAALANDLKRRFAHLRHALPRKKITLSAGETAKMAFARALAKESDLLLLDELTAHMDDASISTIKHSLNELTCAMLIVTHKPSTLENTDWIYVMDDGKIVDQGTYGQLLKREGLFSKLYALETGRETEASALTRFDSLPPDAKGVQKALALSPVFSSLCYTQTAKLAEAAFPPVHLKAGEYVCRCGDTGDSMYSIMSGEVEINGRTFGPGDSFGEIAIFADGARRTADVRCKTDCTFAKFSRTAVLELCEKEPSVAVEILKATATIAARESESARRSAGRSFSG